MGTTQRISPGVTGEPNWRELNRSITQVAKTVEKEKNEDDFEIIGQEEESPTWEQIQQANEYKKFVAKRNHHLRKAFSKLIETGGGAKTIISGKSKSIGRAGLRNSKKIVGFFLSVGEQGFQQALTDIGFNITGKNVQDVIDYLLVYSSESSAGMDETAANKASCEVLNDVAREANNDLEKFEEMAKKLAQGPELSSLICKFWGYYIFEHLSQRFLEKIAQQRGEDISVETFKIIKEDILGQVKRLNERRDISQINWKSEQGKAEIEKIFQSIIIILCDEN